LLGAVLALGLALPAAANPSGPPPPQGTSQDDYDSLLGRRLYPLALARGGAELPLTGSSGRYLWAVFDDLAWAARRQRKLDYTLHVLSSRERMDAWVYPDGSVFVTLGLLRRLPTVDEVAGVLAHQLAHAVLRHNLNGLTSPEAQILLADIAAGRMPPVREKLGRYGVTLLGEFYGTTEERAADSLAGGLLRQEGFKEAGLGYSFRRLVGTSPAYLKAHPHPGLKALPKEPETPPLLIIETEPVVIPPPPLSPPVRPVPPVYFPPTPPPPPPPAPPADPARLVGMGLVAGVFPLGIEASTANLQLRDQWGNAGSLTFQTATVRGAPALGGLFEVPFGRSWQGLFGLGGGFANVVERQPVAAGGFALAGVQQRGSVDGRGVRWAFGPYLSLDSAAMEVGVTPGPLPLDLAGGFVQPGTAITANAFCAGLGVLATISGDSPGRGLSWFAGAGYQASTAGEWSYSTKTALGDTVALPTSGQNAAPLRPTGALALAGIVVRF
jgi:hypothetical protein